MPYTQQISRQNKACFLFLLDQSFSMEEPLGGSRQRKCDQLAAAVNSWLQNMALRACGDEGVKDWMDVGVLGYRTDPQASPIIESSLQGRLAGRQLVSIAEIAGSPARIETRTQSFVDDATGQTIDVPCDLPIWVDPMAQGGTPMCRSLRLAHEILESWIAQHPQSFPPVVIHITDGESQDGDPLPYAKALRNLATNDGHVLLFNAHLSTTDAASVLFPADEAKLPDSLARTLFSMSSLLPQSFVRQAAQEGMSLQSNARGMAFNADMTCLIQFLNMGTRVASSLR